MKMLRLLALVLPVISLTGCAGLVTPIIPCGPNTYLIKGISAADSTTTRWSGQADAYERAQDRAIMSSTGDQLVQKATEWCQKRNLVMIPVEGPHEDLNSAPADAACHFSWILFRFKAVPAGQSGRTPSNQTLY